MTKRTARISAAEGRVASIDGRRIKPPGKLADRFYWSEPWRRLVSGLMAERGRRCQECGREDTRIFGDHIAEVKDGGGLLDPSNVQLLCGSCHVKVTIERRAARLAERVE